MCPYILMKTEITGLDRNMIRKKTNIFELHFYEIKTYLASTSTICCSLRKKEGNIRTNLTGPFLEFLLSSKTTIKLISCPQCSCSIAASTTKPCPSWHLFVKMNLPTVFGWELYIHAIYRQMFRPIAKIFKNQVNCSLPKRIFHCQSSSCKG